MWQAADVDAEHMSADLDKILLSESDIQRRISEMAADIERDYEGRSMRGSDGTSPTDEVIGRQLSGLCVRDAMTTDPITATPDTPISHMAKLMHERRIHRVIVTEDGRPVGIVATLDLVRLLAEGPERLE